MTLDYYALYLLLAIGTVLSPGPAVIYTIGNTLTWGTRHAIAGFCGVAVGILLVASLASLAVLWFTRWLAAGQQILTLGGAFYLLYLGLNAWRQRVVSPVPGPGRIGIVVAASSRGAHQPAQSQGDHLLHQPVSPVHRLSSWGAGSVHAAGGHLQRRGAGGAWWLLPGVPLGGGARLWRTLRQGINRLSAVMFTGFALLLLFKGLR